MEDVFAIFPSRGLDNSILIPIYIGLLIHAFFIESLGWSYAGLVVSGYLASVFAIAPEAGLVISIEIVTTYGIVYFISEYFSRRGWWHSFFGRERFLFFFIISLLVRLLYEVWLFHELSGWAVDFLGMPLDAASRLYGIGLVIVPLASHAMWRPGFRRGFVEVAVPVALTYAILMYVIIPFTNFSIANFELTFQDLALDFTSSPKIYITLILGMLIAARFNLRYGWDFNGIMIPSLLAVSWYMPWKILTTVIESTLVAFIAFLVSSLPVFRRTTLQGIRRLLLIFTIGLGLKFVVGFYMADAYPGFVVSDLFGFGYLLPSLIALNIWENRSWALVVGPTLFTSLLAFLAGNIIGLGLYKIDELFIEEVMPVSQEKKYFQVVVEEESSASLQLASVQALPVLPEDFAAAGTASRIRYQNVLAAAARMAEEVDPSQGVVGITEKFSRELQRLNLSLSYVRMKAFDGSDRNALVLRERLDSSPADRRGWPVVVLLAGCSKGMLMEVPYPYEEPVSLDAAIMLFPDMHACTLLINGWRSYRSEEQAVLNRTGSPFALAHDMLGHNSIVQVRTSDGPSTVFVRSRMPSMFKLDMFKKRFPEYRMVWHRYDEASLLDSSDMTEFAEVVLNPEDVFRLAPSEDFADIETELSGLAWLRRTYTEQPEFTAAPLSERYRVPNSCQMDYLQEMIVKPIRQALGQGKPVAAELETLRRYLNMRSAAIGYRLLAFDSDAQKRVEWLLVERNSENGWGAYLFRSESSPWVIEVPRPLIESRSLVAGMDMYGRLDASALYIAGADLQARRDGLADITRIDNPINPFQAAHRGAYPADVSLSLPWILQVRGMSPIHHISSDALISLAVDLPDDAPRDLMAQALSDDLSRLGWSFEFYDGRYSQIGLKAVDNVQMRYSAALTQGGAASIWISPEARRNEADLEAYSKKISQLAYLDIETSNSNLESQLADSRSPESQGALDIDENYSRALSLLEKFAAENNVSYMLAAKKIAESSNLMLRIINDGISGKSFLLLNDEASGLRCAVRTDKAGRARITVGTAAHDSFRQIRYGAATSICTREVAE